jgi:quercetin dioxygenase-like cupin family protein
MDSLDNPLAEARAEILVPSVGIREDMPFFTKRLGFRLDQIFPADDPTVAVLSGHGVRVRLDSGLGSDVPVPSLRLLVEDPSLVADGESELVAPNGMRVEIDRRDPEMVTPPTRHNYIVRRLADQAPWVIGRAGMHYRDLIPDRLGGSIIASHIRIPDGGPVPDMVHYHTVGFQLIFCLAGWVDLVYEDQGQEFRLHAGDCVIQPPEIRHQVELPNGPPNPDRRFQGQRFVHHRESEAEWGAWRIPGFVARDTGIAVGTNGVASVEVAKWQGGEAVTAVHDCDILFHLVKQGTMTLSVEGEPDYELTAGDAFVIPPGRPAKFHGCSDDLELIEVALPSAFTTTIAG